MKRLFFIILALHGFIGANFEDDNQLTVTHIKSDISHPVFKRLQLCYECEFAPITRTHMKVDGSYDQNCLLAEWAPNHDIFLLFYKNIPAGFCVVNHQSMIEEGNLSTHDIAEFYVTPIFRKFGYGTWFAQYIFKLYPGRWEIRQLPELENTARKFWIKAIKGLSPLDFKEIADHSQWKGFVQQFNYTQ